jgi:hypothetical protein
VYSVFLVEIQSVDYPLDDLPKGKVFVNGLI